MSATHTRKNIEDSSPRLALARQFHERIEGPLKELWDSMVVQTSPVSMIIPEQLWTLLEGDPTHDFLWFGHVLRHRRRDDGYLLDFNCLRVPFGAERPGAFSYLYPSQPLINPKAPFSVEESRFGEYTIADHTFRLVRQPDWSKGAVELRRVRVWRIQPDGFGLPATIEWRQYTDSFGEYAIERPDLGNATDQEVLDQLAAMKLLTGHLPQTRGRPARFPSRDALLSEAVKAAKQLPRNIRRSDFTRKRLVDFMGADDQTVGHAMDRFGVTMDEIINLARKPII